MGFDIRWPIGMMFSVFGLLIGGYGAATTASPIYTAHSLGINVNLWWGIAMLAFGLTMLALARRGSSNKSSVQPTPANQSTPRRDP